MFHHKLCVESKQQSESVSNQLYNYIYYPEKTFGRHPHGCARQVGEFNLNCVQQKYACSFTFLQVISGQEGRILVLTRIIVHLYKDNLWQW